jgi:hypothetical protein
VLCALEGPFALIFYHAATRSIFYARDKLGRRSLLVASRTHLDASGASVTRVHLTSVAPDESSAHDALSEGADSACGDASHLAWSEAGTTGASCLDFSTPSSDAPFVVRHGAYPHVAAALSSAAPPAISISDLPLAHSLAIGVLLPDGLTAPAYDRAPISADPEVAARDRQTQEESILTAAAALELPAQYRSLTPVSTHTSRAHAIMR